MAHGFGVLDKDITYIEDMSLEEMNKTINSVIKELQGYSKQKKRSFLQVYAAGHGVDDGHQSFVINATSGNLYPIEKNLRDFCTTVLKDYCTIYATYDMCKSEKSQFKDLTMKTEKLAAAAGHRGIGDETLVGKSYWHMAGAEAK